MSHRPTLVLRSREFEEKKRKHQARISELYTQRRNSPANRRQIEVEINRRVIEWNTMHHPLVHNYFDLHGMTTRGAVRFATDMIARAKCVGTAAEVRFETGRGNHSRNGIPAIKNALLDGFQDFSRCRVRVDEHNAGVLVVAVW